MASPLRSTNHRGPSFMPTFMEFFAGGGMARAGLGVGWTCMFANDIDPKKAAAYAMNWGDAGLKVADLRLVRTTDIEGIADLAWASFPCQDLSLAGNGKGLSGERSGTFWAFWNVINSLRFEGRAPRMIAIENVTGLLSSNGGRDFAEVVSSLAMLNYRVGSLVIDAARFVPQSRPRLFVVAISTEMRLPGSLIDPSNDPCFRTPSLARAESNLPAHVLKSVVQLRLPEPPRHYADLASIIEREPQGVRWHDVAETERLLEMMSPVNRRKVEAAKLSGKMMVGGVYRRTRPDESGIGRQRAEVRFDDIAGCLRTPSGGSSRQTLLIVEGENVQSRLLSPREAARLMGLPEDYRLPQRYNDAYHLLGDGVVAPVVGHLARHVFEPVLAQNEAVLVAAE